MRRMPLNRSGKNVYHSEGPGMLGRGRPPMSWEGRLEEHMKECGREAGSEK